MFLWWVRWNYARAMGSAIRRQVEVRDDVISLGRLIDRVWRYPTALTYERFLKARGSDDALAPNDWVQLTNSWSSDVISHDDFINPEVPAQDSENLGERTAVVRRWVNKAVAHKDRAGGEAPPLAEVHGSIALSSRSSTSTCRSSKE